jgi:membrane protein implicated in regulation of membrane protease activity
MVSPSHMSKTQSRPGASPSWGALWSLSWRLCILLAFVVGALACALLDLWWAVLACVIGFIAAAFLIRRFSSVDPEHQTSAADSIVFL